MAEPDQQELAFRFEEGQRRLQMLDRHLAMLEQNLADLRAAVSTLEGLEGEGATESLVSLGAGVRVPASLQAAGPFMVDVGAGYTVEMDLSQARDRLRARLESTESAFRAANQEADQVAGALQALQMDLSRSPPSS